MATIGIRKENKGEFERRAPLSPDQVAQAISQYGIQFQVQASTVRVFADDEYRTAGATVVPELHDCDVIMGVKEIPEEYIEAGQAYLFFSHTIKGQVHNMPMLRRVMNQGGTLMDYERITDDAGKRLVFFGYHAGLAGMVDSLWMIGQRLKIAGWETPFRHMQQAFHYRDLTHAVDDIQRVGREIAHKGLPKALSPFVIGVSGYGNVSRGCQFVANNLPVQTVAPEALADLVATGGDPHKIYITVFEERHMARRLDGQPFVLPDYFAHPELHEGTFPQYVPYISLLMNCIYWEPRFPRLVTKQLLSQLHAAHKLRMVGIGDISCDIDGSIEITTQATSQTAPLLVYDFKTGEVSESVVKPGMAVLAVDNLPAELPRDATEHFGISLARFLSPLATLPRSSGFAEASYPDALKRATIIWNGKLTPAYQYLEKHL